MMLSLLICGLLMSFEQLDMYNNIEIDENVHFIGNIMYFDRHPDPLYDNYKKWTTWSKEDTKWTKQWSNTVLK